MKKEIDGRMSTGEEKKRASEKRKNMKIKIKWGTGRECKNVF